MERRQFLKSSLKTSVLIGTAASIGLFAVEQISAQPGSPTDFTDPFKQPPLPYELGALGPFLSAEQMDYHYNKHHAGYYTNLKKLLDGKPEAKLSLEEIVVNAESGAVFNNAAQAWNHAFFWNCMAPKGKGGQASKELIDAIQSDLGGMEKFKEDFVTKAIGVFGSGWCWLAKNKGGKLEILPTSNADCPQKHDMTPILVVDVWEHAYYIDYRNVRANFVKAFLDNINWTYVSSRFN